MKNKIIKTIIFLIMTTIATLLIYQIVWPILPGLMHALKSGDEATIEQYLSDASRWDGYLCTFLLQFIQVVSIVLPGMPVQIAAGMVYGTIRATLFCYLGYVGANIVVFLIVRRIGTTFAENMTAKFNKNWFSQKMNSMHPGFVVAMGCLMPGIPNGIIPYVAAGTKMKTSRFILAVAIGSFLPIVSSCLTGHFILMGDYLYSVISLIAMWVLIITLVKNRDRIVAKIEKLGL